MQARTSEKPSGSHSQRAPLDFPGTPPCYHKEPRQPLESQKGKDNCWETHSASSLMSASFPGRMSFAGALPPLCVFVSPSAVSDSWTVAHQASLSMKFSRKNTGGVAISLLQGTFGTHASDCIAGRFFTLWAARGSMVGKHLPASSALWYWGLRKVRWVRTPRLWSSQRKDTDTLRD